MVGRCHHTPRNRKSTPPSPMSRKVRAGAQAMRASRNRAPPATRSSQPGTKVAAISATSSGRAESQVTIQVMRRAPPSVDVVPRPHRWLAGSGGRAPRRGGGGPGRWSCAAIRSARRAAGHGPGDVVLGVVGHPAQVVGGEILDDGPHPGVDHRDAAGQGGQHLGGVGEVIALPRADGHEAGGRAPLPAGGVGGIHETVHDDGGGAVGAGRQGGGDLGDLLPVRALPDVEDLAVG